MGSELPNTSKGPAFHRTKASKSSLRPTGFVHVSASYPSQGQGHQTTLMQIVASELGVDPEKIIVHAGRTDKFGWGVGTFASRAAVIGGTAALLACRKVRKRALDLASDKLEASPADLDITSGRVHVKGAKDMFVELKTLADLANPIITLKPGVEPGLRATLIPSARRGHVRERRARHDR